MQKKSTAPARQKVAQARLLYDAGAPIAEIAKILGMTAAQFRLFRTRNGWPLRASACARKSEPDQTPPAPKAGDPDHLIERLEEAVAREFARAELALEKHAPKTIEASARTLATLVKTLAELKRMRRDADDAKKEDASSANDNADGTDEPPRELAELRAELARRLKRLRGGGPAE